MAEFLIYNKDHWMDALTPQQLDEYCLKYPNFMEKYNARYQRGDIVGIHEDGFWGDGPYPRKDVFRVVRVMGMTLKDALQYHVPLEKVEFDLDKDGNIQYDDKMEAMIKTTMLKRCRYSILSGDGKDVNVVTSANFQVLDKLTI
jgi:hypothetical protein